MGSPLGRPIFEDAGGEGPGRRLPPIFTSGIDLPPEDQTVKIELLGAFLNHPVPITYGRHIVGGNTVLLRENADGTITLLILLGEGEWDSAERVWVEGLEIDLTDTNSFHFHPGLDSPADTRTETTPATRNQAVCSFFAEEFVPRLAFARSAYIALNFRRDPSFTSASAFDVRGVYKTTRVRSFNASGTQTGYGYSSNPSWCALDLLLRRFLFPHGGINEALPTAVKDRIDFAAWKDWADFCDADLTINGELVNRAEAHVAFVDTTDLMRALEQFLLLGRGYMLERNGKFAAFPDQSSTSVFTAGYDDIAPDSLSFERRNLRSTPNQLLMRFRALDSGDDCNDPRQDFQPQLKEVADEDHQDEIGHQIRHEIDLGNATSERAERIGEHVLRRSLLKDIIHLRAKPDVANLIDGLPGDRFTGPADLEMLTTQDYWVLEITDEPDGAREIVGLKYDESVFVDTAGPQQKVVACADPGGGIARNAQAMKNVLQNASFFRGGVAGQEGTNRPRYWQGYSNAAGSPAWTTDLEHLVADDRVKIKSSSSSVDKIGIRSLWNNLGEVFKPNQFVVVAVAIRHVGASGAYDKDVKIKLDNDAETYTKADSSKFDATIPAGIIDNVIRVRHVLFQLRSDQAVPATLNAFLWSEATGAAQSNEDLEVDFITLASGRVWRPYEPLDDIEDAQITWQAGPGLYDLPAHVVKASSPSSDSGGAGEAAGGGIGSGGDDYEDGRVGPIRTF